MTQIQIAWLELALGGGVGAAVTLSGMLMNIISRRQNKLCTEQAVGTVVQYRFWGEGRMYPVIEYRVDGTCYKTNKKFCGILSKQRSGLPIYVEPKAYEDGKGYLHIEAGPVVNLRRLAEQLWPIGSKMTVYFNPSAPQKCYVDRPICKSVASTIFIAGGIATIILSLIVFALIQM